MKRSYILVTTGTLLSSKVNTFVIRMMNCAISKSVINPIFLFKQLHEITSGAPEEKWNRVRFVLKRNGEFNIDYEWEQELTDEV